MSDDWSTISVKREQMKRELDALREHYLEHRSTLERLAKDAPTQHLAARYLELRSEIDVALGKLTELEGGRGSAPASHSVAPPPMAAPGAAAPRRWDEIEEPAPVRSTVPDEAREEPSAARTFIILLIGFLVIALLVFFGWRYLSGRPADDAATQAETVSEEAAEEAVEAEPETPAPLTMTPPEIDFGTMKKGSRVVRRFELVNNSDAPLVVKVARSTCRCLWFDYADTIPPRGSTSLTVTVDGARAPVGRLQEVVQVTSTSGEDISAAAEVRAVIE